MKVPLRIAVADDESDMREWFSRILTRLGHTVVSVASTGRELVEQCRVHKPDIVITDIRMPEMDGIEAATAIYQHQAIPVILVSGFHDPELIARAEADHIMAYLVKPIEQKDIEPALVIAWKRFGQFELLRKEAADLRQALEDRKVIERAKGLLMKRAGLDEPSAFQRLQKFASHHNRKLVDAARLLITAEEAMSPGSE